MYSSCLCRHIYNNFLFYVFSKILALVSYAKIREEIKFMYVCMYVPTTEAGMRLTRQELAIM